MGGFLQSTRRGRDEGLMPALRQRGHTAVAVARSARPILQAVGAHAMPQAVEMMTTPHAAQRLGGSAVLPQAPFRSQHTKATVKRNEKSNRLCETDKAAGLLQSSAARSTA